MIGKTLQRYEVLDELGRGGMAVVYRARDSRLGREVALKVLHPHLASRPESARRFMREAKAVAKLHHRGIVEIYDFSQDESTSVKFIVAELVRGQTLRDFVEGPGIALPEVGMALVILLADALGHAHEQGIIHRDIKPENVMIDIEGRVKLMDFGIAHVLDEDRMTASGSLLGSPAHMPPEVIDGRSAGVRGDVFSLGTVLYYVTTNALPFTGNNPTQVLRNILESRYEAPGRVNPRIGRRLERIIDKCLERDPEQRHGSVQELGAALRQELAAIGLEHPEEVATSYLRDPGQATAALHGQVVRGLLNKARQHIALREIALATDLLNRLSAYDPQNKEAAALWESLRVRRRLRLGLGLALAVLLMFGMAYQWLSWAAQRTEGQWTGVAAVMPMEERGEARWAQEGERVGRVLAMETDLAGRRLAALLGEQAREAEARAKGQVLTLLARAIGHGGRGGAARGCGKRGETIHVRGRPTVARVVETLAERPPEVDPVERAGAEGDEVAAVARGVAVVIPVYPADTTATVGTKRFQADSQGDIHLRLDAGVHVVRLECGPRCVPQSRRIDIAADHAPEQALTLPVVTMPWADATLFVLPPRQADAYFITRRLDDRSEKIQHLVANSPNAVSGFNAFGKEIVLEVYAIPTAAKPSSYAPEALERAKLASTRVNLGPGETRTIDFR